MTAPFVTTERRGHVLEITLNRPPAHAINRATSRAIHAALRELQDDPDLRLGLLTATGDRIFSAGWDLKEMAASDFDPTLDTHPEQGHGPGGFAGIAQYHDLDKPVIAAVNGAAIGGGFEIALACDVILAAEHAWFQLPEMKRGFLADAGAIQRLPRLIPRNVAVEMLLSGRRMEAAEAHRWGLVHALYPGADLLSAARSYSAWVAMGAPLALRALKASLSHIDGMTVAEALRVLKPGQSGLPIYEAMTLSDDFLEGGRAFAEKREPRWTGR